MSLSKAEREHIIRWDDSGEPATFFTHREKWAKTLIRGGGRLVRESKHDGEVVAWMVEFDPSRVRIPTGKKRSRKPLTDEHKAKLAAGRAKSLSGKEK